MHREQKDVRLAQEEIAEEGTEAGGKRDSVLTHGPGLSPRNKSYFDALAAKKFARRLTRFSQE